MLQTLDAQAIWTALRNHHLPRMRPETKGTLLLRSLYRRRTDIAELETVSDTTIRARLNAGLSDIFETIGEPVERDGWAAAIWVSLHLGCCLAEEAADLRIQVG